MTRFTRSALLEVPVGIAYEVVADVEKYPSFLPGCDAVVLLRDEGEIKDVEVRVSRAGMSESFVTRNTHTADRITMKLERGPLKRLVGSWYFKAIGEVGCRVEVDIDYQLEGLFAPMIAGLADTIADKLVDAFTRRIQAVADDRA